MIIKDVKSPLTICSIFLSECLNKTIYETNKNIKFISIYYGDLLNNYQSFIENGGYSASKEYNLPEGLCPLTDINFEIEFEKLLLNKEKNYLFSKTQ